MTNDIFSQFDDGMASRDDLYEHLKSETEVLGTSALEEAFQEIDRQDFVPGDYKPEAYEDYALPIGHGATISQPTTVAFMLELLGVEEGNRVLDVGSGSGYTTALLGKLVGEKGYVLGTDVVPELVERAQKTLKGYKMPWVHFVERGELDESKKFDRILVSASSESIPQELVDLLDDGGTIVFVEGTKVVKGRRNEKFVIEKEYPGFRFVEYKEK